jgi:class 3 adenylate cyclase
VVRCPSCGEENPARFRLCGSCGAPLASSSPARDTRKTVTILFTDLTGSTGLGERLDPESLRYVMGRYFASMREVIERHGGTVEKYIGDAVMAVFGSRWSTTRTPCGPSAPRSRCARHSTD